MYFDAQLLVFLCAVFVFAVSAIAIVWGTLSTGSPPMPSNRTVRRAMVEAIRAENDRGNVTIMDIGSGWGGLARHLALTFSGSRVFGLELSVLPHLVACLSRKMLGPSNLDFIYGDASAADLGEVDVVTLYLSGPTLASIWPGLESRLKSGTLVVSAAFALPGCEAVRRTNAEDWLSTPIYVYRVGGLRL